MDHQTIPAKGFFIWGICALFFLYEFFLRTAIGTYQHPVMQDLHLSAFEFSLFSTTVFLFIYGIMQLPAGLIVDNIGLKKSLLIGSTCCVIAAFGLAHAHHYPLAIAYRILMGFGASFGFICLLIAVYDWLPHRYNALFIGLSQFIGTLGPMIAAGPLSSVANAPGANWHHLFLFLGISGLLLVILIFLFVENNVQRTGNALIVYKPEKISTGITRLFARIQPWWVAILSASLYFPIEYLSENEGRTFLGLKGIMLQDASYMITLAWIGYAIGCPLLGFFSDMLEKRKSILQLSAILAVVSIVMMLYSPYRTHMQVAFFMLGISASGQSVGFATIAEQFHKKSVAIGFGLNNAMITTTSAISAPIIGLLLDHTHQNNAPLSLTNYLHVFNSLIMIAGIALLTAFFLIKETYCKSAVELTFLKKSPDCVDHAT